MSNHKLIFYGTDISDSSLVELTCYVNTNNELFVEIKEPTEEYTYSLCLDKSTAIKFAKTIRSEINKMSDGGK